MTDVQQSHKSKVLQINPNCREEVYIDIFYWGEGYNPLKHDGVITGGYGRNPEFNIAISTESIYTTKI